MTSSQLTRLINWAAMLIALALLALVFYHIYQRHFLQSGVGQNYSFDDLPAASEAPVSADIEQIVGQHIFGKVPVAPKQPIVSKPKPKPKVVPKTPLKIALTGIIDGATPETGMAMLEVERGKTIVIAVGEKIGKTDATLHQVLPGEVLIDRGGTIESVKMVRKILSLASLDDQLFNTLPQSGASSQAENTLPQPYDEANDPNAASLIPPPAPVPVPVPVPRAVDPAEEQVNRAASARARRSLEREEIRRNQKNMPMKTLPVPKALQRL